MGWIDLGDRYLWCDRLTDANRSSQADVMAGRTERVNARDLIDRADMIIFEGDSCRDWIQKLARRMQVAVESAKGNSYFEGEFKPDLDELVAIQEALERANEQLEILSSAVSRREGKAA